MPPHIQPSKFENGVVRMKRRERPAGNKVSYVIRVSTGNWAAARCCNTANSYLTIDGRFEISD